MNVTFSGRWTMHASSFEVKCDIGCTGATCIVNVRSRARYEHSPSTTTSSSPAGTDYPDCYPSHFVYLADRSLSPMTTSKATISPTTACIRSLPLPPARATTYAQARNLAEKHPEHAAAILRAPLASQNAEPAPRTYAQARSLAAANPERAAEILSRPLSSNPPQKVFKEVTAQVQGSITPRSPLRNAARRAPSTEPRHVIKKPAGPRSQTRRNEMENQFPMPLVSNKKPRPPVASPASAGISSPLGSLQSAPMENTSSAQILVSKSDIWAQEAAVVPAVKLPARPAIYAISTQVAGGVSLAGLSEVVGISNVGTGPALSTTAVREVSVIPGPVLDGTPTVTEYNSVHASVVNGTAHSAAIMSYVDGDVFSPDIAPPSSPRVSLTPKRTESLSPAVASSSELAPLSLEESQIHSADQDSHSAKITTSKADVSSPSAKVSPDATSDQHTNAGSSEVALDSSAGPTGAADVRLVDKQTAQASLSPSLRITPTRRKSALELASVIAAQNPGHIQMQGTPSHTTVDRLRLAIAAERALSRRPDIAARINLAFAAASEAPDVVATPLAPSMRFVRPAPQYAFKRTYRNVRSTQAATVPQFVAGMFPHAPSTPYEGELLGYVEVDAW
ncbi:hypothetical protein PENSPDRAFT_746911 [Peniophora sp. CONT]|nr:hypothetical protein PENSPDRAFT_746911 [Peniophora sp. CONT]